MAAVSPWPGCENAFERECALWWRRSATVVARRPIAVRRARPRRKIKGGIQGAGLDVHATQPAGEPSQTHVCIDGSGPPLRQRQVQADMRIQGAAVGQQLGSVPGAARRDINVVAIHRRIEQDETSIRRQTLRAVNCRGVGMTKPCAAMLVGDVGGPEGGAPPVDGDADERIAGITMVDPRDGAGGPVDNAEAILAYQKPDLVTPRELQRLSMPRRRDGGDGDFMAVDVAGLLQPCADFLIERPHLGWTTDAPFRETAAAIAAARASGVLAVEMEAAALYTFARKRNKAVLCLAHVTNTMGLAERDFEKGEAGGTADALMILEALTKALSAPDAAI
jgi:hypothetical protein